MDEKLHIVQHLYGEGDDPAALQHLLEDDGLRADYEALSEAKHYLDGRPPPTSNCTACNKATGSGTVSNACRPNNEKCCCYVRKPN